MKDKIAQLYHSILLSLHIMTASQRAIMHCLRPRPDKLHGSIHEEAETIMLYAEHERADRHCEQKVYLEMCNVVFPTSGSGIADVAGVGLIAARALSHRSDSRLGGSHIATVGGVHRPSIAPWPRTQLWSQY